MAEYADSDIIEKIMQSIGEVKDPALRVKMKDILGVAFPALTQEGTGLTSEQVEKYVEKGGRYCPYCHSELLETIGPGIMHFDGPDAWIDIKCADCKKLWTDEYKLSWITEAPDGE